MADVSQQPPAAAEAPAGQLEQSTYEIIRQRLNAHAQQMRERLEQLNEARRDVFGSIETHLLTTQRITSAHNCVPRDMVPVGQRFIFGYNVHLGLKSETDLSDVFAVFRFEGGEFHEEPLTLLQQSQFESDFKQVYKYYKSAQFAKFQVIGPHLFMIFRVGRVGRRR